MIQVHTNQADAITNPSLNQETFRPALELLQKYHDLVANDYICADNGAPYDCNDVANKIVAALRDCGVSASTMMFWKEERTMRGHVYQGVINPLRFEGRVRWQAHHACVCQGQVFDPLSTEPVPLADYAGKVFGEPFLKSKLI